MLSYELTDTGYIVHRDNKPWVVQPYDPAFSGFVAYTPEAAQAAAEALIASQLAYEEALAAAASAPSE